MPDKNLIDSEIQRLQVEITSFHPLLKEFPPEDYIRYLRAASTYSTHKEIPENVLRLSSAIKKKYGTLVTDQYHKLILLKLMRSDELNDHSLHLHEEFLQVKEQKMNTLFKSIQKPIIREGQFSYSHERFIYYLRICLGISVAFGPFRMNKYRPGLGYIKYILQTATHNKHFVGNLKWMINIYSNSPMLDLHIDQFDMDLVKYFNEKGWKALFRAVNELFIYNPDVKAITGNSWFFDPVLKNISPEIAFIRELIDQLGGQFYFLGQTKNGVINATRGNFNRKELYKNGLYHPVNYLFILTRDSLEKNAAVLSYE